MILRAYWMAFLFMLIGYHVRLGFDRVDGRTMKIYIHLGTLGIEPVSVVVKPHGYTVVSYKEINFASRRATFVKTLVELEKY
jgi:uncharacterized lipoprotein YddW (UPF0748 family)